MNTPTTAFPSSTLGISTPSTRMQKSRIGRLPRTTPGSAFQTMFKWSCQITYGPLHPSPISIRCTFDVYARSPNVSGGTVASATYPPPQAEPGSKRPFSATLGSRSTSPSLSARNQSSLDATWGRMYTAGTRTHSSNGYRSLWM
jgi:hypothetical protein